MCLELAASAFSVSPPEGGRLEPGHPFISAASVSFLSNAFYCKVNSFPAFCTSPDSLDLETVNDESYESPLKTLWKPEQCQPHCVVHKVKIF